MPNYCYRWQAADNENPYMGILAWADRLIVTGDSIAMLSEACATRKPVMIFDLGGMRDPSEESERDFRIGAALYAFLLRWLWQPLSRDITLVHKQLRASGRAKWLDEDIRVTMVPAESDLQRAVKAVQKLLCDV